MAPVPAAGSGRLRDNGMPAWQRLQAVRAVEAYRDLVLESEEPSLADVRVTLSRCRTTTGAIHLSQFTIIGWHRFGPQHRFGPHRFGPIAK